MTTVKDFLQVCINTKALKLLTEFKVTHHGGIKNFKKWGGGVPWKWGNYYPRPSMHRFTLYSFVETLGLKSNIWLSVSVWFYIRKL